MPKNTVTATNTTTSTTQPQKRLYVFLHGLICLVDLGTPGFAAFLLENQDHRYLCGDWLLEREITASAGPPLKAGLVGVRTGNDKLDSALNVVVRVSQAPSVTNSTVRAVINLPRPDQIGYFVQGKFQPNAFQGDRSRFDRLPDTVSGLRVFQYLIDDPDQVAIVGDDPDPLWQCPSLTSVKDSNGNPVLMAAVHIYNEPDHPLPNANQHNLDEFNQSLVFLNVGAKLSNGSTIPQNNNIQLPGILGGETMTLDARLKDGQDLLVAARLGQIPVSSAGGGGGSQVCGGVDGLVFP